MLPSGSYRRPNRYGVRPLHPLSAAVLLKLTKLECQNGGGTWWQQQCQILAGMDVTRLKASCQQVTMRRVANPSHTSAGLQPATYSTVPLSLGPVQWLGGCCIEVAQWQAAELALLLLICCHSLHQGIERTTSSHCLVLHGPL